MKDIQNEKAIYQISIEQVGIKEIEYPLRIQCKNTQYQHSVAKIKISVELPKEDRGTHMSRFVELIEKYKADINGKTIKDLSLDITKTFNCKRAFVNVVFPFFIEKRAPVSRISSIMQTTCGYKNIIEDNKIIPRLIIEVPATTLCPCSKEISKYGAHNQRASVKLEIEEKSIDDFIWFEDLIDLIEGCASAPIYPLLKREDEKFVTEQAYDNPRFVEDLVREVYTKLLEKYKEKISYVKIEAESNESIHQHKAFAVIEKRVD